MSEHYISLIICLIKIESHGDSFLLSFCQFVHLSIFLLLQNCYFDILISVVQDFQQKDNYILVLLFRIQLFTVIDMLHIFYHSAKTAILHAVRKEVSALYPNLRIHSLFLSLN